MFIFCIIDVALFIQMDSALDSDPFDTTAGVKKAIHDDKDSDVLSAVVEDDYEDEDDEELEDDTHKIPMVFIFGILVLFLCAGGLLFNLLEYDEKENNRWTFAASVYFSTISFLTIGNFRFLYFWVRLSSSKVRQV